MGILFSLHIIFLMRWFSLTRGFHNYYCDPSENITSSSAEYKSDLGDHFKAMPSAVVQNDGCYHPTSDELAKCLGLCRSDIANSASCTSCINHSIQTITNNCPVEKNFIAWGDDAVCMVRCNSRAFDFYQSEPNVIVCNKTDVSQKYAAEFRDKLARLTSNVATKAASQGGLYSFPNTWPRYYATDESDESKLRDFGKIYVLGMCVPTLSENSCTACLQTAAQKGHQNCTFKQGATVFMASCILRYELYRFYYPTHFDAVQPPFPQTVSSPAASSPSSTKKGARSKTLAIVISGSLAAIGIIIGSAKLYSTKRKKNRTHRAEAKSSDSSLEFHVNTIRAATNDFSPSNLLGRGGFGAVYKGTLPNGRLIAVKRLFTHFAHREEEFEKEVRLVAKLHHKNLIKLLGFCFSGNDRILIYELAVHGSLDSFLFEYVKHGKISVKIDLFSFGVLLLEIIRGRKNCGPQKNFEHLLSKAWNYWRTGKPLLVIDPMLRECFDNIHDITRCIHIALLCVQENATSRPTMNSVILMLESSTHSFPPPSKPAYYMEAKDAQSRSDQRIGPISSSSSSSHFSSVNEISITQPYPECR